MIKARSLTKRYGAVTAVDDLSFDVVPGVVTGFLGPNGAGKSTTMRMILGLDRPSAGAVTVGGRSYRDLPAPLHEVGALLDADALQGGRSAADHLRWIARAGGVPDTRVAEVLETVGLAQVGGRRVAGFSLGMRQRLGLAAALLGDPATLLLDEPANGLDPEGIRWIRTFMRRLAAGGRTVLVSSHLLSEMQDTVDRVIVIGRGRFIADLSIGEAIDRGGAGSVRVVSPQGARLAELLLGAGATVEPEGPAAAGVLRVSGLAAARIGDLAAEHHLALHELTAQRASLEEAFLGLTQESVAYRAGGDEPRRPSPLPAERRPEGAPG
jgi:ABC-2 type transport system ATP-binding protein